MVQTYWHKASVSRADREALNGHRGVILWYTGLSGSGKSTLANAVAGSLHEQGVRTFVLDGDNVRKGLNADLGFAPADRVENIRRFQEVAKLFLDAGFVVSAALISPYREDRDRLRQAVGDGEYVEIYCRAPLDVCEGRDPKGLYKAARKGEIDDFTGVSAPYEEPTEPELVIDTAAMDIPAAATVVLDFLAQRGVGTKGKKNRLGEK